jgi:CheY-like chemotaxis protein
MESLEASDGQEGLDVAAGTRPDLIVMDAMMPVMDGFEATRRLSAGAGAGRYVPIIATFGQPHPGRRGTLPLGGRGRLRPQMPHRSGRPCSKPGGR